MWKCRSKCGHHLKMRPADPFSMWLVLLFLYFAFYLYNFSSLWPYFHQVSRFLVIHFQEMLVASRRSSHCVCKLVYRKATFITLSVKHVCVIFASLKKWQWRKNFSESSHILQKTFMSNARKSTQSNTALLLLSVSSSSAWLNIYIHGLFHVESTLNSCSHSS